MVIQNLIEKKSFINMLFYGEPGTGKTSMILAIARCLYGDDDYKSYIKEINASSDKGIDVIRTEVKDYVKLKSKKIKLVILDEIDAMSVDAQGALRGIIDDYSRYNRFCLICNNIEKIIPALKSRCLAFNFARPSPELIFSKLKSITELESININDEAIMTLASSNKDLRQLINLLQAISGLYESELIDDDKMKKFLGINIECYDRLYHNLITGTFEENWTLFITELKTNGLDFLQFVSYVFNAVILVKISNAPFLLNNLAKIEYRVKNGGDIEINMAYLISIFIKA
jgi:replication factor C subunit 3/5